MRIFRKEEFKKLYLIAPKLGIDTICWDNKKVYGVELETLEELEEKYEDHHELLKFQNIKIHHDDSKKQVQIQIPDSIK